MFYENFCQPYTSRINDSSIYEVNGSMIVKAAIKQLFTIGIGRYKDLS